MNRKTKPQAGMAMIVALIAIVVIVGALVVTTQIMVSNRNNTTAVAEQRLLADACKSGIDFAVEQIWNQYIIGNGNTTGNLASYKYFIDDLVTAGGTREMLGDTPLILCEEQDLKVDRIRLRRTEEIGGLLLAIDVDASLGDRVQRAEQTVRIAGAPFTGFEYAVLANYINCILCHAGFYSLPLAINQDEEQYGNFDRVKVATLEALLYRPSTADSRVAGTIYTRGSVYNEAYLPQTPTQIVNSDLKSYQFSTEHGKLAQDDSGKMVGPVSLRSATMDAQGRPEQFASLYTNYPREPHLMTDGPLPESFPAPFPDYNENRLVDDAEFEEVAQVLNGSLTGGVVYGVPKGGTYAQSALPVASNDALASLSANGRYDGNVILVGTSANPIVLDGEIAINGDLMIAGKVKGWGQLFVRGNTYITGDVTYADAPGEFGVAEDGTRNGLALVTGGSVLLGDYLTIRGTQHTADAAKYPDHTKGSIHMRRATINVSNTVGTTQTYDYGYFSPGAVDAGEVIPTMVDNSGNVIPRQGQQFSFTVSELQLFNNLELDKALADPSYTPRFYGLRDSQPNNIYVYTRINEEHAVRYDEVGGGVKLLTDRLIQLGVNVDSILNRAAFHYMNPDDYWISEDVLRQIWWNDEQQRSRPSPWKFDGLLYSNNAIFAITRSYARHWSHTDGKMVIRGAIVCPDLGVLAPGPDQRGVESFTMLYDPRAREFWTPSDATRVVFERLTYRVRPS